MKYEYIGKSNIKASRLSLGLMRLATKTIDEAKEILKTAFSVGINFFDHADIYGKGESEIIFAKAMKELNVDRSTYYLQSKVGIMPGIQYNFSKEHILKTVDEILERLNTTYLDSLLLHRPDMLWEPEEINEAFKILHKNGKVRNFGVSNMHQNQVSYLKSRLDFDLIANQLQFSIMHADMATTGVFVNTNLYDSGYHSIGILDYMREHNITIQAWSPFQFGRYEGVFVDNPKFPLLNEKLEEIAKKYNTTKTAISVAWINRHPAKMQTIIGTMTPSRIVECAKGIEINLTREEWYEIYFASGNKIL
ncbi:aldo/keto reductase [Haploplasma modicum]|jgi:predicted oxidoreductase|uniref:aldo/keto reductase n=1 Tax=Haploplasma modicum TaxID=2150 RepID=UPI00047B0189|nr:aldo/keto reductase [Haploplasma modicum]